MGRFGSFAALVLISALLLGPCGQVAAGPDAMRRAARDADGDGLCDFEEVHKYRTHSEKADTDGDGTPEGDWNERSEQCGSWS